MWEVPSSKQVRESEFLQWTISRHTSQPGREVEKTSLFLLLLLLFRAFLRPMHQWPVSLPFRSPDVDNAIAEDWDVSGSFFGGTGTHQ